MWRNFPRTDSFECRFLFLCRALTVTEGADLVALGDAFRKLEDAVIELYSNEIAPLVELGISGLVYTQLSDVEDETNGLITYDRRHIKVNPERLKAVNKRLKSLVK